MKDRPRMKDRLRMRVRPRMKDHPRMKDRCVAESFTWCRYRILVEGGRFPPSGFDMTEMMQKAAPAVDNGRADAEVGPERLRLRRMLRLRLGYAYLLTLLKILLITGVFNI